ncbi:helix-turn-helix domain-containing protein [Tropicimonas aquimaris]|uniref:Multiprotein-bridging factor 1 family protein n=1 Tax=Tropicimonas aquimaris TaxID=914152 RepID=A0ABW3IWX0_9RHOB
MAHASQSSLCGVQIRAARGALRWSVEDLAERSGVSGSTIKRIEATEGAPKSTAPNLMAIRSTLEAEGIEFIGSLNDRPGIRMARAKP